MHLRSKRLLAVFLCFSLVVVGIFCNLSSAYAKHTDSKVRVDMIVSRIRTYYDSTASESFISYLVDHIDDGLILVCLDLNNDANFTITMWGLANVGVKWSESTADSYYLGYFHPNNSTGYVYRCDGFFNSFYNNGSPVFQSRAGYVASFRPDDSRLVKTPDFSSSNNKLFMGSAVSYWSMDFLCLNNQDIYASYESASVLYKRSLYGALVSLYQNVVFYKNDRLYFTFSDQDVVFDVFVGSADAELRLTVEGSFMGESGEIEYGTGIFLFHESDFVRFPDIITFEGVTNIRSNGLRAIDITALSNYSKLLSSRVYPDGYYELGYFADNEVVLSNIITTPTDPYDTLGDALEDLNNRLTVLENAPVPDYELQGYITFPDSTINGSSYPDLSSELYTFGVSEYGIAYLYNRSTLGVDELTIQPRSVIVLRQDKYTLIDDKDIPTLWSQADVVIILSNQNYDTIVNSPNFDPVYIYTNNDDPSAVRRGSWFLADWENYIVSFPSGFYLGPGFFTEHYLMCVNNYILSDGFSMIADGLTKLGEANKDGFQAVASSVGSVYAAVQLTNSNWASFLRDFVSFKDSISIKIDLIIDKLDVLINNTDEKMHDYWIRPVYDFIHEFTPSLTGFGNWIDEIETDVESLPLIPVVTVPALPTLPPLIEGD